jgi:hypothetical protein
MESQLDRPRHPDAAPDGAPTKEREGVNVVTSAARCPFCRAQVAVETQEWVACQGCLARHHASCWDDNGSCASCHATKPLAPPRKRAVVSPALALALLAALLSLLACSLVVVQTAAIRARLATLESRPVPSAAPAPDPCSAREETIRATLDELEKREATTGENPRTSVVGAALATLAQEYQGHGRAGDGRRVECAAKLASLDIEATKVVSALDHPASSVTEIERVVAKSREDFVATGIRCHAGEALPEWQSAAYLEKLDDAATRYERTGDADDARRVRAAARALKSGESSTRVLAVLDGKR